MAFPSARASHSMVAGFEEGASKRPTQNDLACMT